MHLIVWTRSLLHLFRSELHVHAEAPDLHKASLASSHQQPAIAPECARVGLVLEAGQRGQRPARVGIKDDDPRRAGHRIIVGIQRAEVYACYCSHLHEVASHAQPFPEHVQEWFQEDMSRQEGTL